MLRVSFDPARLPQARAGVVERYLAGRKVAVITSPGLSVVSINDPAVQQLLDHVAAVRALLDTPAARAVLLPSGAGENAQVRLDGAAVRLSSDLGRDLTRAASLVLRDIDPALGGIGYRSRHDDTEDCWAIYDHAPVEVSGATALSADNEEHRAALGAVATLWRLPLPPPWRGRGAPK